MSSRSQGSADTEFKSCCADFYANDIVRNILGDSFHPGGRDLTRVLLGAVGAGAGMRVLDLAAGQGTSSILAAVEFGCHVTACDLSEENLQRAQKAAVDEGVGDLLEVKVSDAESLPFDDGEFDIVLCECAFCVFPDKTTAAREMARVLRPGGKLALSDMTISETNPPVGLDTLLMRVACIADAVSVQKTSDYFAEAGFLDLVLSDASAGLVAMVEQIRGRILALELAEKIGKVDLGGVDIQEGKRIATGTLDAIKDGSWGYATLTGVVG